MKQVLFESNDVAKMITAGKRLLLAGDERVLRSLPAGTWIGGTIPYFMGEQGGIFTKDKVYVTELPDFILKTEIKVYDSNNIHQVYSDAPLHGFSFIIIPASCDTHYTFALNAPNFPAFAVRPLIGWIAGGALTGSRAKPRIFNGLNNSVSDNGAVVMHVELPANKLAEIDIINIFEQGDGDTITFPRDGFSATTAFINGRPVNFTEYLREKEIDTRLLLIANLYGANINVSFKNIDYTKKQVDFYSPVFAGLRYKIAKTVDDYFETFISNVPENAGENVFFACNCIVNFKNAGLEGRKFANFTGPITFGEIAYQLMNQTLVYMTIQDI